MIELPLLLIFPLAMAFAAVTDLFTMTIPNRISLALVFGFLFTAPLMGMPMVVICHHVATAAVVLAVGILMFSRGWLGGGDAKLLATAALWLGHENLLNYLLLVTFIGGVLASGILIYRSLIPPVWVTGQSLGHAAARPKDGNPVRYRARRCGALGLPLEPVVCRHRRLNSLRQKRLYQPNPRLGLTPR